MDLEEALLSHEPHPILTQILTRFVLNLRPQARNVSADQISSTVLTVLAEFFKTSERTVFWSDELMVNVDPFQGLDGGFFAADWDLKLKVLRQLVELQLTHSTEIKGKIDRAWGVVHNKHKKKELPDPPPLDPMDPNSMENLQFIPFGQDMRRTRFWIVDDSPRVYTSTNPWKVSAVITAVSSTREEYVALVDELKERSPGKVKDESKRSKMEHAHIALVKALEGRLELIDNEIARIQKARKKIEQRNLLLAQAEIRQTRTRRQTKRPDYVYYGGGDEDEDEDEYKYAEDDPYEDPLEEGDFARSDTGSGSTGHRGDAEQGRRRSTRTKALNGNGKRLATDTWNSWRGERRSARLGAPSDIQMDEPRPKRARTEESTISVVSVDDLGGSASTHGTSGANGNGPSAAAVKPNEIAMEQVAGRKKSKFWYYAVEPIPTPVPVSSVSSGSNGAKGNEFSGEVGNRRSAARGSDIAPRSNGALEGSLSPASSLEDF